MVADDMACSKIDPALHQAKKPDWIRVRLPSNPVFFSTKALVSDLKLHTVCEEAQCPNRWECWSQGTATFMIAGDRCTRACGFCAVTTAKPFALEDDEPQRVAEAVRRMRLKHVVVTAVARDDLKDGGAEHFARTIKAIRGLDDAIVVEVLTPDFHGRDENLRTVIEANPNIFNHNLETVERLTPMVRSRAECFSASEGDCSCDDDQERYHARARRRGDGDFSGDGRSQGSRGAGTDDGAVSEAEPAAFAGGGIHSSGGV